jgi:hypothetical protein
VGFSEGMKTTLLESTQDFITLKGVEGSGTSLVPKGSILTCNVNSRRYGDDKARVTIGCDFPA